MMPGTAASDDPPPNWTDYDLRHDFEGFYRACYPAAMAFATLTAAPGTDIENAVANAFVEVWARRASIQHARGYLYAAIRNTLKNPRLGRETPDEITDQHADAALLIARAVGPAEAIEFRDVLKVLQDRLTENQRIAFYLSMEAGWAPVDIAELLDCSTATVRVHLSRARRRLRAARMSSAAGACALRVPAVNGGGA